MTTFTGIMLGANVMASLLMLVLFDEKTFTPKGSTISQIPIIFVISLQMGGIAFLIGTLFIFLATRIVVRPITQISAVTKRVTKGDFTARVYPIGKRRDEITALAENVNVMVTKLSRNEYLHQNFVSNVSHEFKTPLAAIQGYAELLMTNSLQTQKRLEYAQIIMRQSNRLSKLSSNLLRLSELEEKSMVLKQETFRLDEQIRDAMLLLQTEWQQKQLQVEFALEEVFYTGDKELLYQVWVNLLSNAIKYNHSGGFLRVTLTQKGQTGRIHIMVSDHGIGMTEEQVSRVFERFYKADAARGGEGTGLGLSIVKRILELHDGEIFVESNLGTGTDFTVVL